MRQLVCVLAFGLHGELRLLGKLCSCPPAPVPAAPDCLPLPTSSALQPG